jgi:hypothetical protein
MLKQGTDGLCLSAEILLYGPHPRSLLFHRHCAAQVLQPQAVPRWGIEDVPKALYVKDLRGPLRNVLQLSPIAECQMLVDEEREAGCAILVHPTKSSTNLDRTDLKSW